MLQKQHVNATTKPSAGEQQAKKTLLSLFPSYKPQKMMQKSTKSGTLGASDMGVTMTTASLQQKIASLEMQTLATNGKLTKLAKQIAKIHLLLQSLSSSVAHIARGKPQRRKQTIGQKQQPIAQYKLRAIIPGRAWISAASGKQLTINSGEYLQGYGKIVHINAAQGIVSTSSGKTITFN